MDKVGIMFLLIMTLGLGFCIGFWVRELEESFKRFLNSAIEKAILKNQEKLR
jgi:hypothetical protein